MRVSTAQTLDHIQGAGKDVHPPPVLQLVFRAPVIAQSLLQVSGAGIRNTGSAWCSGNLMRRRGGEISANGHGVLLLGCSCADGWSVQLLDDLGLTAETVWCG